VVRKLAYSGNTVLIGDDRTAGNGFTATYRYPDQPLNARLILIATGPDGTAENDSHMVSHAA
jgi:hypothetical protein